MKTNSIRFEMIGSGKEFYCYIEVDGKLTHEDYEFFIPSFESAIQHIKEPKIDLLINIENFNGWEIQAAWDDLKFSLKHGKEFNKLAVVGQNRLLEYSAKISAWLLPYDVKFFEDIDRAKKWLLNNNS
ncbi:MAG: STAS/SEC14 domain-containing protein [Campylobacterota bacterium]|nr:STAS/SEC14 domain-containing protein [Campylobacterota bacterium]